MHINYLTCSCARCEWERTKAEHQDGCDYKRTELRWCSCDDIDQLYPEYVDPEYPGMCEEADFS